MRPGFVLAFMTTLMKMKDDHAGLLIKLMATLLIKLWKWWKSAPIIAELWFYPVKS